MHIRSHRASVLDLVSLACELALALRQKVRGLLCCAAPSPWLPRFLRSSVRMCGTRALCRHPAVDSWPK
eukprot:scaffold2073_cov101-Isochrysis_galbana.AAC.6